MELRRDEMAQQLERNELRNNKKREKDQRAARGRERVTNSRAEKMGKIGKRKKEEKGKEEYGKGKYEKRNFGGKEVKGKRAQNCHKTITESQRGKKQDKNLRLCRQKEKKKKEKKGEEKIVKARTGLGVRFAQHRQNTQWFFVA